MKQFGFSNSTQLKVAYANALLETGAAPEIKSARLAKAEKAIAKEVAVGKPRDHLIL